MVVEVLIELLGWFLCGVFFGLGWHAVSVTLDPGDGQ